MGPKLKDLLLLVLLLGSTCVTSIASIAVSNSSIIIAFAANEGFQYKLIAVIERIRSMQHGRTGAYKLIGFDLGFKPAEAEALRCASPPLLDELRPFNFDKYPKHVRTLGCYAWKPLLLNELRQEYPQAAGIVWLDTAVAFHGPSPQTVQVDFFERAVAAAAGQGGALSDRTARALADFTHPNMFAYFQAKWSWSRGQFEARNTNNCNGAFSAWSFSSPSSSSLLPQGARSRTSTSSSNIGRNASSSSSSSRSISNDVKVDSSVGARIMEDWVSCALEKACVCPEKSNRGNHRQDQAALSLTMAMHGLTCRGPGSAAKAAKTAAATAAIAAAAASVSGGGGGATSESLTTSGTASSTSRRRTSSSTATSRSASNGREMRLPSSRQTSTNGLVVDPYQVHWVRTHTTRPKRKSTREVLAAHAPKCLPAYEAAVAQEQPS